MPSARGIAWLGALAVLVACTTLPPADPLLRLMPYEVRSGLVESALTPVEREIAPEEIREAVAGLVSREPQCFPWPTLWLAQEDRRSVYVVRFDLMARDWGENLAGASEQRMNEFVEMGFLTRRERPDRGPRVTEFALTPLGSEYLQGSPYGSTHPSFCPPAGRRVAHITNVEWGAFSCGNIQVRFTHTADQWPEWARTENARNRLQSTWGALGDELEGSVSLSRRWYRRGSVPGGVRNGSLQSACFDAVREQVTGDDLQMTPPS